MQQTRTPDTRPAGTRRPMRTDIQALRALAVVAVLGYHFVPGLVPGGYVGVDVFFVISGFVITSLMITEMTSTGGLSFAKFYARRARRILPAATVTITLTVLAGLLLAPMNTWGSLADDAFFTAIFGQNWHLAAESVDYLAGGAAPSPMQHFWSLSIEEQFYFLWPAALVAAHVLLRRTSARRAATAVLVPTILVSFVLSALAVGHGEASAYFTTHARAWQLAVGALLAAAWPAVNAITGNTGGGLEPGTATRRGPRSILLVGGAALIGYALFTYTGQTPFPGVAALAPTLGTAALIAAGAPSPTWVRSAPVQWLGNVSYSPYLVHRPIALFLPAALTGVPRAAVGIALSLALAHLGHTYVEQGLPRMLTRSTPLRLERRTLLAGGAAVLVGVLVAGTAHQVYSHGVARLDAEALELQEHHPDGFGAGSISAGSYTDLLPGTRGTAPSRASVRADVPGSQADGCMADNTDPRTPECTYGDRDADTTWVLAGDSHIEQYLPAFEEVARDRGIRLVTFFHANCPLSTAQTARDVEWGDPCEQANEETLDRVAGIGADLIITSNWTTGEWEDDPVEGLLEAWAHLDAPIFVIADNPHMRPADGTTACVVENFPDTATCAVPREEAMPTDHQVPAVEQAAAAGDDVELLDLTDAYCTDNECPPVIGSVMVYRDPHHITVTYMRTLAPIIWERLGTLNSR